MFRTSTVTKSGVLANRVRLGFTESDGCWPVKGAEIKHTSGGLEVSCDVASRSGRPQHVSC